MVLAIFRIVISLWLFVYLCKSDQTLQSESFNKQCTHVNEKYQLIVSKYPGHNEHGKFEVLRPVEAYSDLV